MRLFGRKKTAPGIKKAGEQLGKAMNPGINTSDPGSTSTWLAVPNKNRIHLTQNPHVSNNRQQK